MGLEERVRFDAFLAKIHAIDCVQYFTTEPEHVKVIGALELQKFLELIIDFKAILATQFEAFNKGV